MKKKIILLFLVGILILSGCAPKTAEKSGDTKGQVDNNAKATTSKVDNDKVFVVPITIDFASLAPNVDESAITKQVLRNMHDAIYKYDSKTLELKLSLAKEVKKEDGGKKIIVTLKNDIHFHDGKNIEAQDVVYSYKRLAGVLPGQEKPIDPVWALLLAPKEGEAGSITAIDKQTVEFKFNDAFIKKYGSNIDYAMADAFIIPADTPEDALKKTPIGAGAYKFKEYMSADHISFERFDEYHGEKPEIKNVEFRIYPDDNAKFLAFKSGEVQFLEVKNENYDAVKALPGAYKIEDSASQEVRQIWLNQRSESRFHDIRLRQAMNYAVDKQKILDIVNGGRGLTLDTHLSIKNPAYNKELKNIFTYNPDKAKALLKEAGFENGFDVDYFVVAENQIDVDIATVVASQLEAVGIKAKIKTLPWSEFYESVYKNKKYEMAQLQIVAYPDAYRMLSRFTSTSSNVAGQINEAYDKAIAKAAEQVSTEASGSEVLNNAFKEAQQILVDNATNVFLVDTGVRIALGEGYTGYSAYPFAYIDISSIKYK